MLSAGISVDPSFESSAHAPQQRMQRIEYQNHLALSVASFGIAENRTSTTEARDYSLISLGFARLFN